ATVECFVVLVDVVAEHDGAVACHPAGEVDPGDRHLVRQVDGPRLAGGNPGIDRGAVPTRDVGEHPGGEIAHVVDAAAAVRVEAVVVGKQIARTGVVHVHRIRVRHVDLDVAERVPAAGILTDGVVRRTIG